MEFYLIDSNIEMLLLNIFLKLVQLTKMTIQYFAGTHSVSNSWQSRTLGNDDQDPWQAHAPSHGPEDEDQVLQPQFRTFGVGRQCSRGSLHKSALPASTRVREAGQPRGRASGLHARPNSPNARLWARAPRQPQRSTTAPLLWPACRSRAPLRRSFSPYPQITNLVHLTHTNQTHMWFHNRFHIRHYYYYVIDVNKFYVHVALTKNQQKQPIHSLQARAWQLVIFLETELITGLEKGWIS